MEEKKSYKADLENKRATGFLLGLIVALSVFIVVLEYTIVPSAPEVPDDVIEDIVQELELTSDNPRKDMVAAAIPVSRQEKSEKINIVEEVADVEISAASDDEAAPENNGEGMGETESKELQEQTMTAVAADGNGDALDFRVVEELPEYPGGMVAFMKWLTNNLHYPYISQKNKKQGKVIVSFIINKDGTVSDMKLVKGVDAGLDREALRVLRMMPKWKPGKDNGKPCRTYFCIPVVFKL